MSLNPAFDQALLTDSPLITRDGMALAAERLLSVADEACSIAERLNLLSTATDEPHGEDAVVATEQITRAIAWLNEAQGALLFG